MILVLGRGMAPLEEMRTLVLLLILSLSQFSLAHSEVHRCENLLRVSRFETVTRTLEPARLLLAEGASSEGILGTLGSFRHFFKTIRSENADLESSLQNALRQHLQLDQMTLQRFATQGRSGDPVFSLRSPHSASLAVKVYSKSLSDLAKEFIGMATLKSAGLQLSRTVDLVDLIMLEVQGKEYPVLLMSVAHGNDMTQTLHHLGRNTIALEDAKLTASHMGAALAEMHGHFAWNPPPQSRAARVTKNYETTKARDLMNQVQEKMEGFIGQGWMSQSEASSLISHLGVAIHRYVNSPTQEASFIHGDLNAGNIFFDFTTRIVTFIDTQLSGNNSGPRNASGKVEGIGDPMSDLGRLIEAIQIEGIEARISPDVITSIQNQMIHAYLKGRNLNAEQIETGLQYFRLRFDLQQLIGQIYIRENRIQCLTLHHLLQRFHLRHSAAQVVCQ